MDKYSGEEIINAFRTSNSKVIKDIYVIHHPMIRKLVLTNNGIEADIEDLLSDAITVFVLNIQKDKKFVLTCTFSTYIYSVCRKLWLNKIRNRKNNSEILYDTNTISENIIDDYDIDELITDSKKYLLYLKHFSKISELCQKVIQMFLDKISIAEIAIKTGVSEISAKQRNYDCKKKLISNIMDDAEFGELALNL